MRRRLLAATVAVLVTAGVVTLFTPPRPASMPARFDNAVLAAELVRNADEMRGVYGTDAPARRCLDGATVVAGRGLTRGESLMWLPPAGGR